MKMLAVATIAAFSFSASAEEAFSEYSTYTEEVVSVAPYRIRYQLSGMSTHSPESLEGLGLSDDGLLVYSIGDKAVRVASWTLFISPPALYSWGFDPFTDEDPTQPVRSISDGAEGSFSYNFAGFAPRFNLSSEFVVELKPGFFHDPSQVRLEMHYLKRPGEAPYVDVFVPGS
ncbi:hypothetical protein EC912_103396 [Luteibacter rhizovicinus]|uniref:Uncharacterized protein n=1 Tax=Luteibacter rhizovicinus TaxID=242606 RepID=A0A4R3YPS5_9GAMM|nr:hypothetical protein [Luteibacter rhizovicinus]TCV94905.1 hypothetical protein EC912_103396 [Luteibacter rhizovicinus]